MPTKSPEAVQTAAQIGPSAAPPDAAVTVPLMLPPAGRAAPAAAAGPPATTPTGSADARSARPENHWRACPGPAPSATAPYDASTDGGYAVTQAPATGAAVVASVTVPVIEPTSARVTSRPAVVAAATTVTGSAVA